MNDMTVGIENLPNIFINKITLNKKSYGHRYLVSVGLYDHKDNPSWRGKIHDLKIKIVFESRPNEISKLNEGLKSLQQYEVAPIGMSTQLTHEAYEINASSLIENRNEGDYDFYSYVIELDRIGYENLNVYAACFIDGFGFGIPMFDKFYGPIAAERIFVGGELNTLSNYFYYPDTNEEYGGPVHLKPDGSYMEGSQHSEEPHKDVMLVTEENYKIQAQNFDMPSYLNSDVDPGLAIGGDGGRVGMSTLIQGPQTSSSGYANSSLTRPDPSTIRPLDPSGYTGVQATYSGYTGTTNVSGLEID